MSARLLIADRGTVQEGQLETDPAPTPGEGVSYAS
jgi:hypothetical protein